MSYWKQDNTNHGDISTLLQSRSIDLCYLVFNSSYLEFTRCYYSEYVLCFILSNCLLVKVFGQWNISATFRYDTVEVKNGLNKLYFFAPLFENINKSVRECILLDAHSLKLLNVTTFSLKLYKSIQQSSSVDSLKLFFSCGYYETTSDSLNIFQILINNS